MNEIAPIIDNRPPSAFEVPGLVRISYLSPSPEGFIITTRQNEQGKFQTLRMREGLEHTPFPFPASKKENPLRAKAKTEMEAEVERSLKMAKTADHPHGVTREDLQQRAKIVERVFQTNQHLLHDAQARGASEKELAQVSRHIALQAEKETSHIISANQRDAYIATMLGSRKAAIRNVEVNGNAMTVDVKAPYFRMYKTIDNPTNTPEAIELANPAAVAMVVTTADGKLILQYRKPYDDEKKTGNFFYGGIPGASAAGMFDAPEGKMGTGQPGPLTSETATNMAFREALEEVGLRKEDVDSVAIAGLAQDLQKPHDEFLLVAQSNKTVSQISEANIPTETKGSDYDFDEKFFVIDTTPEAIETLLTQVQCPLPPTHLAVYFAAGYIFAIDKYGPAEANRWKEKIQKGVANNYANINRRVQDYWSQHADTLETLRERKGTINTIGYDAKLAPEQQGLPSLHAELERTELIERFPQHAYLFDIDGVITNPLEKKITQPEIITHLIEILQKGQPLALITGRALPWVEDRVINELRKYIEQNNLDISLLDNVYVAGEFGGSTLTFSQGEAKHEIDPAISVPQEIIEGAREITDRYGEWVFTDTEKQTQYTAELQPGKDVKAFHQEARQQIADAYRRLLAEKGIDSSQIEVHEDRIAINIRSKKADKRYATSKFLTWLRGKNMIPQNYIAFGDSSSDLEMGIELYAQQLPFEFAYTGNLEDLAGKELQFHIRNAGPEFNSDPNHTDAATVVILNKLKEGQNNE